MQAAKQQLQKFNALHPYLSLIANANGMQPFDLEVVEAYWLGNRLLENVEHKEIQKTIVCLQKHGLPRRIAERKAAELPESILPHHSMHVLYLNFLSQKVKPFVQNLSNCLIQWATVQKEAKNGIEVKGIELFLESNELKLREKIKTIKNSFNLQLQQGNLVSLHWENAVEKISSERLKNLKEYTSISLKAINNDILSATK